MASLACVSYASNPSNQIQSVTLSADGKLLAIVFGNHSESFIYEVPVNTGKARRLTKATRGLESSPSFSPDGKQIVYAYWPGKDAPSRIMITNVDGSNPHEWSPSGVADLSPVFSPDNKTIVFSRAGYDGNYSPIAQPHAHDWSFYASNLSGDNARQLTTEHFYMVSPPSISPDGKTMVVVTEGAETGQRIAVYSITDPGPALCTFRPHIPNEADHKNPIFAYPNFLPDGSVFFLAPNGRWDYDLYELTQTTGFIKKLTDRNGYATNLKVSVDGTTAVFLKWKKNWLGELAGNEVDLLDVHTEKVMRLTISGLDAPKKLRAQ